jgi:hypothetical protein
MTPVAFWAKQEEAAIQIDRRHMLKGISTLAVAGAAGGSGRDAQAATAGTPQWDIFELALKGPQTGNPFRDVTLSAIFRQKDREVEVGGFYDGDGVYRIRFMPDAPGAWSYRTRSSAAALDGKSGHFQCIAPQAGVRGPVRVRGGHHFGYADGTPYFPFGTTSYAWIHQPEALQRQTLSSLKASAFNKLRMCVFPKSYEYNHNEPELYPFVRDAAGNSDFTRPDPAFFRHLEARVADLCDLGVECDLILFHPYDRWGYAAMCAEDDDHYLRYVMARLSACRNIWWSMANEYDLMKAKTTADFDRMLQIVAKEDPSAHLRSIHYSHTLYDYTQPWITHASLQTASFEKTDDRLAVWKKPVVYDEVQYEGNLDRRWGNLSGEEMTWRVWRGVIAGGYVTHGETLLDEADVFNDGGSPTLWWAHGGALRGDSPARIGFLRGLVEEIAGETGVSGLEAEPDGYYSNARVFGEGTQVRAILYFMDYHAPIWYEFPLPEGRFSAELVDPWTMTRTPLDGQFSGKTRLKLSGKAYRAAIFRRV